jgi:hypothetical protein
MKLSQLKNIIKESVKKLMNEQTNGIRVRLRTCQAGLQQYKCVPQGTQLGDRFTANMGGQTRQTYVKTFLGAPGCNGLHQDVTAPQGTSCPNCDNEDPQQFSCAQQTSSIIPCWGCENGTVTQVGGPGSSTGFNNSNNAGICGSINGVIKPCTRTRSTYLCYSSIFTSPTRYNR